MTYSKEQLEKALANAQLAGNNQAVSMIRNQLQQMESDTAGQLAQYSKEDLQTARINAKKANNFQALRFIDSEFVNRSIQEAQEIQRTQASMSTPEAWVKDMGMTLEKALPNIKRLAYGSDNPELVSQIQEIEARQDKLRSAFPSATFAGDVALPSATMAATLPLGFKAALTAGTAEAISLTGSSESPRINGAIAALAPFAYGLGKKIMGYTGELSGFLVDRIDALANSKPLDDAGRALKKYMEKAGITADELMDEYISLGDNAVLGDVNKIRGASQTIGTTPAGRMYQEQFEARQLGQEQRILDKMSEILGYKSDDFLKTKESLIKRRSEDARVLYSNAYAVPVTKTDKLNKINQRLKNSGALSMARQKAGIDGLEFDLDNLSLEMYDVIKRSLDDSIGQAFRSGLNDKGHSLKKLKNELLAELDLQNPSYAAARNKFAGDSAVISATETGSSLFKMPYDTITEMTKDMTAAELDGFRLGAVKAIDEMLAKVPDTADNARRLWNKRDVRRKLELAFPDKAQFDEMLSTLKRESDFTNTLRDVYQGSQTAQRQAGKEMITGGWHREQATVDKIAEKVFSGSLSDDAQSELARLLFDKKTTPKQIDSFLKQAGIPHKERRTLARKLKENWGKFYSKLDLDPRVNAMLAAKLAPLEDE